MNKAEKIRKICLIVWIIAHCLIMFDILVNLEILAVVVGLMAVFFGWLFWEDPMIPLFSLANILFLFSFFVLKSIKDSPGHHKIRIASLVASYLAFIFGLISLFLEISFGPITFTGIGYLIMVIALSLMAYAQTVYYHQSKKNFE